MVIDIEVTNEKGFRELKKQFNQIILEKSIHQEPDTGSKVLMEMNIDSHST